MQCIGAPGERAGFLMQNERRRENKRRAAAFDGANENARRRTASAWVNGQDHERARVSADCGKHFGERIGAMDCQKDTARFEQRETGTDPGSEAAGADDMCVCLVAIGRRAILLALQEGRVCQDEIGRSRVQAGGTQAVRREKIGFGDKYTLVKPIRLDVCACELREVRLTLEKGDTQARCSESGSEAGGADPRADIDGKAARVGRDRGREQHRVGPGAMAGCWLLQTQTLAEKGVPGDLRHS